MTVRPLADRDILEVWERGQGQPAWLRALLPLAPALPHLSHGELAALSLGRRNAYLFALRTRMVGPSLEALVRCPECGEPLEFAVDAGDLCPVDPTRRIAEEGACTMGEYQLCFRPLCTSDLAATVSHHLDSSRLLLIERCLLQATRRGEPVTVGELPDSLLALLAERLSESDPQAETLFRLDCPACGHAWSAPFDIGSYFWEELNVRALRLLDEVHELARGYGWREADILDMTPARRHRYLEMVA